MKRPKVDTFFLEGSCIEKLESWPRCKRRCCNRFFAFDPLCDLPSPFTSRERERERGKARNCSGPLFNIRLIDYGLPLFVAIKPRPVCLEQSAPFRHHQHRCCFKLFPRETGRHFLQNVPRFRENRHQFRFLHDSFRSTHSAISVLFLFDSARDIVPLCYRVGYVSDCFPKILFISSPPLM